MNLILNIESVRFPLTGIGRYTHELALALQASGEVDDLKLFAGTRFVSELPQSASKSEAVHGIRRFVQKSAWAMEVYRLLMPALRSHALKGRGEYIYHSPNFFLPNFHGPMVATFHDLSPFTWPECHDPAKVRYLQRELRQTLDRADRLITDSEFNRRELADFAGISRNKIDAVPLASGPEFCPRAEVDLVGLLERYQLTYQGFTLFVGTIEPRKNIISLLQAYEKLPHAMRCRWPLVLTGYYGWLSEQVHSRIKLAEQEGWARYLGFLPAENLPGLYSAARLFAFPSHYEGFGLPVLEAMSSGVPVVCSNNSSLPEVTGGAALMCDSRDVDSLSLHLRTGLEDTTWRAQAVAKGLEQASLFSWQRCANETIEVYRKMV